MNKFYTSFVSTARELAVSNGLSWNPQCDDLGNVSKAHRWNLSALRGLPSRPTTWMSCLGYHASWVEAANQLRSERSLEHLQIGAMPVEWQEFYQSAIINELLIKKNKPSHTLGVTGASIRILALCAEGTPPWDITGEIVQFAYNTALLIGRTGHAGISMNTLIRRMIDSQHLADRSPLARFCAPYRSECAQSGQRRMAALQSSRSNHMRMATLRKNLHDRKRDDRLPDEQAFWELVRIIFTEAPKTFADAVRFAQVKLAIITGFRVGENVTIPADWERWREYVDARGNPAGQRGGISRSLMIRHFAEKQAADEGTEGIVLYETAQHVPTMFEDTVLEILGNVADITKPLRDRLRQQAETGRFLPEYQLGDLVHSGELFVRLSGSSRIAKEPIPQSLLDEYRRTYNPQGLAAIHEHQRANIQSSGWNCDGLRHYWEKHISHGKTKRHLIALDQNGNPVSGPVQWDNFFLRIADVEEVIRRDMPTKHPHLDPYGMADGSKCYPYDLLFLTPNNCNVDHRHGNVIAVDKYFSFGRVQTRDIQDLTSRRPQGMFTRYGETEEIRNMSLQPHSLRHLQNAELFRLGVADTIITKRFNRRSVAQSYQYDHRSLAEDLNAIDLPPIALEKLGPRAQEAYRMIAADKVSGPIVDEFRRVQRDLGDDAAFEYLDAEADGLHATPYGFCLSSFTIDPCPKHLECFAGCRHLTRTAIPEEQRTLERLRDQMIRIIDKIEAAPADTMGRKNQLRHARERLANIQTALSARPGTQPFAEGPDLSKPAEDKRGNTVLDTRKRIQRASDD